MGKRILGIVLVIIGLIALVGAGIFVYVAIEFSTAMGMLSSADPTTMSQMGIGAEQISSMVSTVQTILAAGFIWLIMVIITALYAIYAGIGMIRKKK